MHIISPKKLKEFWEETPQAESSLRDWLRKMRRFEPANLPELRETFPHADLVGKCIVFNIGGGNYRVITKIFFREQTVLVRFVLSHAEYDRNKWKTDC